MKSCLSTMLMCLFPILLHTQPAFTSQGETCVGDAKNPFTSRRPSVGLQKDGACWVVWGEAAQWFTAAGVFDGGNRRDGVFMHASQGLADDRWVGIVAHDSVSFYNWGGDLVYVFCTLPIIGPGDSSAMIFSTTLTQSKLDPPEADTSNEYATTIVNASDFVWIAYNIVMYGEGMLGHYVSARRGIALFDVQKKTVRRVLPETQLNWNLGTIYFTYVHRAADFGVPLITISPLQDGKILLLSRGQCAPYPGFDPRIQYGSFKLFSVKGDSLTKETLFETLDARSTDLSDRVVLGRDQDFFHVHCLVPSDTLVADRYTLGNVFVSRTLLLPSVLTYPSLVHAYPLVPQPGTDTIRQMLGADYKILPLPPDRYLMMWSQADADSTLNVYTGILDSNMTWIALPKRVNSSTVGNHSAPDFEVKGDSVYAVWLDTRSGARQVYLRRFSVDQITAVDEAPNLLSHFAIEDISPNPVRLQAVIRYSIASSRTESGVDAQSSRCSLVLYDLLGRVVRTMAGSNVAGTHTAVIKTDGLQNGMYRIALYHANKIESRSIIVLQ
jgi:hypothetical protein